MNQLIRCVTCDGIFFKTPFDRSSEYELSSDQPFGLFQAMAKDDFQDFLKNHSGHPLEALAIIEDSFISEKGYLEPIKISYFKATNGKDDFLIKRFRERMDEPLRYELIRGEVSSRCIRVEIQSEAIAKQLETELNALPLSGAQITSFVQLYRHIVQAVDIQDLERASEESPHPLVIYYKPNDVILIYLLRECRHFFEREYSDIEKFIDGQKEDGVLLLKATFKIQVREYPDQKRGLSLLRCFREKKEIAKKK